MNKWLLVMALLAIGWNGMAQIEDERILTLKEVIALAHGQSPDAKVASTTLDNRYWAWRTFKANYMPQLSLSGSLPDLNRTIVPILQDDGTTEFTSQSQAISSLNLSLSQNIGLTGGSISVLSQLQRINLFGDVESESYQASPFLIRLSQPIFGFNSFGWQRKIQPLVYEESIRTFSEEMEGVANRASDQFFALLLAQKNLQIAEDNLNTNDTLYQIAQGRYNLGKIAENDLLQLELTVMNSRSALAQAKMDIEQANLNLAIFLGMTGEEKLTLVLPSEIPEFNVDGQEALRQALANRADVIQFERQLLEAERDLAQAKGDGGVNFDVNASYGLTQSGQAIQDAYQSPQDQQTLQLGISMPLLDWGRNKASIRTATANKELVDLTVQQRQLTFNQEVLLLAKQFELRREKVRIAKQAEIIADRRYLITEKRYKIGKIDILDLNVALQERITANQGYIQALQTFWGTYYELRQKTLYDFEAGKQIQYELR